MVEGIEAYPKEGYTYADKDSGKYIGLDHEVDLGKNGTRVNFKRMQTGDINGDKKIDMLDYQMMKNYLSKGDVTIDINSGDLNKDGKINIFDLVMLRNIILVSN